VPLRILHQLRGGIETHRLAVQQGAGESSRLVAFEPRGDIDQQRETGGMRFGEAVFAEALDLLEDLQREFLTVFPFKHAIDEIILEGFKPAFSFPGSHCAS